jgi:ribonucleotide monophosphatase NagD (HAD superfamily)
MIGDNPESDIAGANTKGWTSILVKTGVYNPQAPSNIPHPTSHGIDLKHKATHIVKDF